MAQVMGNAINHKAIFLAFAIFAIYMQRIAIMGYYDAGYDSRL